MKGAAHTFALADGSFNDPDPADPFFPEPAGYAILETIEIATQGEDCDECVRKLRPVLKKIDG